MDPIVIEYVRLCPDCQKRKPTNHHTTAYSTPCAPFEVWQVDLVGSLPISPQGFSYALTAVDMFSKYLISIPLANKDTITVASGLTQIFTTYGVCNTIISDRGTEFTSVCMAEVCRQLCIPQDTPGYVHHCLGAFERSDEKVCYPMSTKTAITGLVFYQVLLFSTNQSVNAGLGYSPHHIIFGVIVV